MKVIIEITNQEEAEAAQKMLSAYLGHGSTPKVGIEHTEIKKPEKKVPANRAKDSVKKDDVKPVKEPEEKQVEGVDLAELTKIAKAAVAKTDRVKVKDVISAYGAKLSEVEEADYTALAEELKAL